MPIRVGETLVEAGAGACLVPLGRRPDSRQIGVPLIGLAGARPGPTLGIIAGIHGDEYEEPVSKTSDLKLRGVLPFSEEPVHAHLPLARAD